MSVADSICGSQGVEVAVVERGAGRRRAASALAVLALAAACASAEPRPRPAPSTARVPTSDPEPQPTVTTSPPTPERPSPTEVAGTGDGVMGFVGCSVTRDAVTGYDLVGGARLWPPEAVSYSGGSVSRWAMTVDVEAGQWRDFTAALAANPTTRGLWVQLCTAGTPADDVESAIALLDELRARLPGVPIWVSAQPGYVAHECGIAGPTGPDRMQDLADELVRRGHAFTGPLLGPLTVEQTLDGCHANADGQRLMGEQLVDFFGATGTDGAVAAMPDDRQRRPRDRDRPGETPT